MRFNIYLSFDSDAKRKFNELYDYLRRVYLHLPPPPKMEPHISLLVFDTDNETMTVERFNLFAESTAPFSIAFNHIDSFHGGAKFVLFAKPRMSKDLRACHARLHELFSDVHVLPAYQDPLTWQPHVTIVKSAVLKPSERKERIAFIEAQEYADDLWRPRTAYVKTLGLIDVRSPLTPLAQKYF